MKLFAFWSIAAALAAVALAVILPPLLGRRAKAGAPDDEQVNAAVYRARLGELENEVEFGTLDPADFEQAKLELERELLAGMEAADDTDAPAARSPTRYAAVTVAILLPLVAVGAYTWLGTPEAISLSDRASPGTSAEAAPAGDIDRAGLERMVTSFAARLEENPDQGDGWLVLGRAYVMLEQYQKAVLAFANAHMLLGDTPDVLVDFAEAEALTNQNRFTDSARRRIEKALELDPDHQKGLWLGAFAAAQRGDTDVAISRWHRLLEREPDAQRRHLIEGLIAQVQGIEAGPLQADAAPPDTAPAPPSNTASVRVRVNLAASLREGLDGSETVFVFARAAQGPRVPLAVYRTRVDALPAQVTLDDSMSMAPAFKLSGHDDVMIVARVSMTGNAQAQSGDLEGKSGPVRVGADSPVDVSIDRRIP